MSQPGKVDLSMFERPPPAAPLYRSAQPAVQQNPFAPAQPATNGSAAQPNPFTQPAAAAYPFSPPPAPAPADPFSPPPAAPDPFSSPPNGFRGASAAPIADNPFAPAAPTAPVVNPFFGGPSGDAASGSDSLLGALDPDAAQPEESLTVGEIEAQIAPGEKEEEEDGKTLVLSRQDTFHYLAQLGEGSRDEKLAAARALKFLAFNATPEYKSGLIEAGVFRMLLQIMDDSGTAAEHAASCMHESTREYPRVPERGREGPRGGCTGAATYREQPGAAESSEPSTAASRVMLTDSCPCHMCMHAQVLDGARAPALEARAALRRRASQAQREAPLQCRVQAAAAQRVRGAVRHPRREKQIRMHVLPTSAREDTVFPLSSAELTVLLSLVFTRCSEGGPQCRPRAFTVGFSCLLGTPSHAPASPHNLPQSSPDLPQVSPTLLFLSCRQAARR